ncbi:hypothetical protein CSH63_18015 [Micromonospora tulbaghiae]|uniref:Uncharacterized protein n=1 Tax=Micromonospora tulbaghiae TaxID=479978 RepID=A0A386WLU5_9ACTN|nr:hypothetical protein [Micromonospora tulbaghiae]AYF29327.1 hypothetical protein CSH63_18015 [Micromonospora tulbaghiae]
MATPRDHAVVYVPATITDPVDFAATAAPCLERIEACGYAFDGIVRRWTDAQHLMDEGQAQVVIVRDRGHMPHDRRPRIEAADDPVRRTTTSPRPPAPGAAPTRRPRRI